MLRRVEKTVDGKTNVQILGRAAHLKLDQLGAGLHVRAQQEDQVPKGCV